MDEGVVLVSVVEGVIDVVRVLDGVVEVPDGVIDGAIDGEIVVIFSVEGKRVRKIVFI